MRARNELRRERLSWVLVLALGAAVAALMAGGCAAEQTPVAPSAKTNVQSSTASPATAPEPTAVQIASPAPPPPAAAPAARDLADFQWPDPLPQCAADVPPLFKGLVIGTWVPEGDSGFDHTWIDERGLREAWTRRSASRRTWKGFAVSDPTVLADSLLADRDGPAVGYLFSLVSRVGRGPEVEDEPAVVHLRHRGRLRAFIDGLPVLDLPAPADGGWGEARAPVVLSGLYDVLLLKLGRGSADLGPSMDVEVRVSAPDGRPIAGQTWNTMRPGVLPSDD